MFDLAPVEKNIAQQAIRSGQPIPDRIANAPQLELGLQLYLTAFFDLDADRSVGMEVGRIPWSIVELYARAYEFDEEQTEKLHYFIKHLDSEHLKRIKSKQPK